MEDFLHKLLGNNVTVTWIFLIVGCSWIAYIQNHR
jgi:hypothetical protein